MSEFLGTDDGEMQRYSNLTWDDTVRLLRLGRPFIVTDAGFDFRLKGWGCSKFAKEFPQAEMRAEYADDDYNSKTRMSNSDWRTRPRKITESMRPHPDSEVKA